MRSYELIQTLYHKQDARQDQSLKLNIACLNSSGHHPSLEFGSPIRLSPLIKETKYSLKSFTRLFLYRIFSLPGFFFTRLFFTGLFLYQAFSLPGFFFYPAFSLPGFFFTWPFLYQAFSLPGFFFYQAFSLPGFFY